jgi:arylsulfatase A-like enzyme
MAPLAVLMLVIHGLALSSCGGGSPPNILLVSIDTLRADHLKSYGYGRETAPTLSRLASEGAQFMHSYSQASSTVPTHASMFTGRFPFQHRAFNVVWPLRETELTLAELLHEQGYRTFAAASSFRFQPSSGFSQGFDTYDLFDRLPESERSAAVTARVVAHLERETPQPFFGFVHYFDPHAPYAPPEPYRTRWHPGIEGMSLAKARDFFRNDPEANAPELLAYMVGLYDGEIGYLDAHLEQLLAALDRLALSRDTILVVTSDHGEEFQEHGGFGHAMRLHEEVLRVPLIIRWSGRIDAGLEIDEPVQTVDLFPTLVSLAGLPLDTDVPGRDWSAELLGRRPAHSAQQGALRDVSLAQERPNTWSVTATVRGRRLKLIVEDGAVRGLFDLRDDPGETRDVRSSFRRELRQLRRYARRIGLGRPTGDGAPPVAISPETRRRLRELGYAEEDELH